MPTMPPTIAANVRTAPAMVNLETVFDGFDPVFVVLTAPATGVPCTIGLFSCDATSAAFSSARMV
jgi:hypothetical protein